MSTLERLKEIVESLRIDEHTLVGDGFYSCPMSPYYFGNRPKVCTCGMVENNKKVDDALKLIELLAWKR